MSAQPRRQDRQARLPGQIRAAVERCLDAQHAYDRCLLMLDRGGAPPAEHHLAARAAVDRQPHYVRARQAFRSPASSEARARRAPAQRSTPRARWSCAVLSEPPRASRWRVASARSALRPCRARPHRAQRLRTGFGRRRSDGPHSAQKGRAPPGPVRLRRQRLHARVLRRVQAQRSRARLQPCEGSGIGSNRRHVTEPRGGPRGFRASWRQPGAELCHRSRSRPLRTPARRPGSRSTSSAP